METHDSETDTIEVPILELDFDKFLEMTKKINIVDCITFFSMPNHVKTYSDREKLTAGDLILELIEYQKEENEWRLTKNPVADFAVDANGVKFLDKNITDAARVIVVSKMNSIFIIPGENSIKSGNCQPNQIIKLSNLISSQLFLLKLNDVKEEASNDYELKVEFALIDRTAVKENHDN